MKGSFNLAEAQQRKLATEPTIATRPCVICGIKLLAPYGRWFDKGKEVWTCGRVDEAKYHDQRGTYACETSA